MIKIPANSPLRTNEKVQAAAGLAVIASGLAAAAYAGVVTALVVKTFRHMGK